MAAPMKIIICRSTGTNSYRIISKMISHGPLNYVRWRAYAISCRHILNKSIHRNISSCHTRKTFGTWDHCCKHKVGPSVQDKGIQLSTTTIYAARASSCCATRRAYSRTSSSKQLLVLGIETSCDDTGAAVVDQHGRVLGEALISQTKIHVEMGGIIPHTARDLHMQNIEGVVQGALQNAGISVNDVDAIACTVEPGLTPSLYVGSNYAKRLVKDSGKPFIPIHHMQAHALTARMIEPIEFPFLVLLASGGHCLLAVARDVDDFVLLGSVLDDAPGDAFDKTARKLKLKNLPECAGLSGGAAIEKMAQNGDPNAFPLTVVMGQTASCDFSFAGIKAKVAKRIQTEEEKYGLSAVDVLPSASDICANFQYSVLHHLAKRVQRALLFCELKELLPLTNRTMVVSGGVASNMYLRTGLQQMCAEYDCNIICPPPKLCTDNGIMIAWNGVEKLMIGRGIVSDPNTVIIQRKSPIGIDIREDVRKCWIKLKYIKI